VHDLYNHLTGCDRFHHLDANGLFFYAFTEGARDVKRDVGFKQCAPNLTQCAVDLGLAERPAAGKAVKNAAKSFG
jgi:hypothetical protein